MSKYGVFSGTYLDTCHSGQEHAPTDLGIHA